MRALLFSFLASSFFCSSVLAAKYELDKAHTSISFVAPHLMVSKVKGRFDKFEGSFDFDPKSMKLDNIIISIRADSINTNEEKRDKHLRSPDFFDVEKFPELKFKSSKVIYDNKKPAKPVKVEGDLSIHGVTKPVVLQVEYGGAITDPMGNQVVSFSANTNVNRKDFGVSWNKALDTGGWVVGDNIKIEIDGEAKVPGTSPDAAPKTK